jgi:hypothetical protein
MLSDFGQLHFAFYFFNIYLQVFTVKIFLLRSLLSKLATVCSIILTVNLQKKSIKSHTKPIKNCKYFCHFICFVFDSFDYVCEFTVKIIEHTVASYENSDLT